MKISLHFSWSSSTWCLKCVRDFSIAGVEFDTDEEAEENKQSSSIMIANNNENTEKVSYSDGKNQINLTFNMN